MFHLAAVADVEQVNADPVRALRMNVEGTGAVLEAARRVGVNRFVLASTVWVYGAAYQDPEDRGAELTEDVPFDLGRSGHLYVSSKLAAEMAVQSYREMYGQHFTILRYGIPYGPRMRDALVIAKFVQAALAGRPITIAGEGGQTRNFVYVEDLAAAHVLALSPDAQDQTIALEGTTPISIREIADTVDGCWARSRWSTPRPAPPTTRGAGSPTPRPSGCWAGRRRPASPRACGTTWSGTGPRGRRRVRRLGSAAPMPPPPHALLLSGSLGQGHDVMAAACADSLRARGWTTSTADAMALLGRNGGAAGEAVFRRLLAVPGRLRRLPLLRAPAREPAGPAGREGGAGPSGAPGPRPARRAADGPGGVGVRDGRRRGERGARRRHGGAAAHGLLHGRHAAPAVGARRHRPVPGDLRDSGLRRAALPPGRRDGGGARPAACRRSTTRPRRPGRAPSSASPSEAACVLIMSGAWGLGPVADAAAALGAAGVHVLAVAGRNPQLEARLRAVAAAAAPGPRVRLHRPRPGADGGLGPGGDELGGHLQRGPRGRAAAAAAGRGARARPRQPPARTRAGLRRRDLGRCPGRGPERPGGPAAGRGRARRGEPARTVGGRVRRGPGRVGVGAAALRGGAGGRRREAGGYPLIPPT